MSWVVSLLVVVCVIANQAWAGNSEAEELFRSGRQLSKEGNYEAACAAFEKSNELEPNTNTLLNLGDCLEKNNKYASAWKAFLDAAQRTKGKPEDAKLNEIANTRAQALEKKLSFLTITVPASMSTSEDLTITMDGKSVSKSFWNIAVAVDAGKHELVAKAPGRQDQTHSVDVIGEAARTSVAFTELPLAATNDPASTMTVAPTASVVDSGPTPGKDPERKRLFFGAALGEEEMRGAEGSNWFFALEGGHQWPISRHVFFRLAGGPRYQHMNSGPENAIAFQVNPSIGYIIAGRLYIAFEPTLGVSSAGNQVIEMGELENSTNPYYKLFTFSAAYVHQGLYEIGFTFNFDGSVGEFHSSTNQLSLAFRYHL